MKAYLFLFLIGIIISFDCVRYITERLEGVVTGDFFIGYGCSCPIGFTGIVSDLTPITCTCFLKQEINECKADSRCETAASIGCRNK